jgi:simple sugar transport system permease protein
VLAVFTAIVLGGILIVLTDFDHLQHIGTDPLGSIGGALGAMVEAYAAMLSGGIGDPGRIVTAVQSGNARDIAFAIRPITETLLAATPFIFGGLAAAVAFRTGLFNLGLDGQFLIGGLGAAVATVLLAGSLPPFLILLVGLVVGTLSGAAYGFLPGLLKARTGAHEVLTTLMLNMIASQIAMLVLRSGNFGKVLTPIAAVPRIFDLRTIRLDWGFVAALVMTAVISFVLFRTTLGFELRATGFSRSAARSVGMAPGRTTILGLTLSGGLAGMGSAFVTLGPAGQFAPSGVGFVALALALIGGLRPSGVALAALLYGVLDNGASTMGIVSGIPLALIVVIIALVMMFVAAPSLTRMIWRLGPPEPAATPTLAPPDAPATV